VVQKARALQGSLTEADVREAEQLARAQAEQARARQKARQNALARESSLLLAQFDDLSQSGDPQKRGYALQDILTRLFNVHGVAVKRSFMRNQGAEQIDGAFELEGWHYIVECRWRERMADIRQLDGLLGQLGRSGRQTMGLFLSINGWSEHVVDLLKQNNDKSIILMEGYDLRTVLSQTVDLRRLLKEKLSALNLRAEPYLSARDVIVVE
jgi:multidrug efflux pump subunit AcrA (membrane-fusion protein)